MFEKTGRFWTFTMTFSEMYNTLVVKPETFFHNKLPFRHNERKRDGRVEKMTDFQCLLAVVTWFYNFSKIALVCLNRMQEDTFVPNLGQIGRETAEKSWREKKKKQKENRRKNLILPKF